MPALPPNREKEQMIFHEQVHVLKQQIAQLEAALGLTETALDPDWQQAESICALLHGITDQVQRHIVQAGHLSMMSAAQTIGAIPCVFAAKDDAEEGDDARNEVPIYIEVASDGIPHGLTVYIHANDPEPRSSFGEAMSAVFLEHYQSRVQLQLFDALNGPGGDMHWVAPAEPGLGHTAACLEREQESSLVLIPDTRVKNGERGL
jgi:hypothetical protein